MRLRWVAVGHRHGQPASLSLCTTIERRNATSKDRAAEIAGQLVRQYSAVSDINIAKMVWSSGVRTDDANDVNDGSDPGHVEDGGLSWAS